MTADFAQVWLSPTSAWRLSACPASLAAIPRDGAGDADEANAGSLAHLAVQRWIDGGYWHVDNAASTLVALFDQAADDAGIGIPYVRDGRLTRARLRARAAQIAGLLATADSRSDIACEIELRDPERRLRGIVDLALLGQHSAVVDLKTGRDAAGTLSPAIHFQLLVYAHLFRVRYGRLPDRVEAFSLSHGTIAIDASANRVDAVVDAIAVARTQDPGLTRPDPETCRFCARRFTCGPHWQEVRGWDRPDAVEGRIVRVEEAETGAIALLIDTPDGAAWVIQIPAERVPTGAAPGNYVRLVRLTRMDTQEIQGRPPVWRAGALTGVATVLVN